MQIQNALITGSFSYNGADLSNITSSNAYSASLSIRTTDLESTSSVLVGASSSFSSILSSVSSSQQQLSSSFLILTASFNAVSASYTALSASYNTASSSFSTRITSDSSSMSSRTTQVEKTYASTGSNTFTGLQNFSNTCTPNSFTAGASIYTAGGLQVTQDSYFSSSVFIKGNVTVFGTQSVSYISSSQLDIGTNIITVNTSTPSVRYGGLSVFDSGSTGLTGSIFWDSELNRWIYTNASGSGGGATYGGGMFISGPRNSVGLGCEQGTTACMLLVGQGGDHLTSSMIYHSSTVTCIPGAIVGGSTACFTGNTIVSTTGNTTLTINGTSGVPALSFTNTGGTNNIYGGVGSVANITIAPGDVNAVKIFAVGCVSCFAGTICAPSFVGGTVDGTIINSTSNAFRFSGNNALSLVTLCSQSVVKINAAGYWGVQLVGANDKGILIDNTGQVAMGTSTMNQKLTIVGSYVRMESRAEDNTNAGVFYKVTNTGTTVGQSSQLVDNAGNYIITTGTSSETERFRITGAGIACFACQVCAPAAIFSGCVGMGSASPQHKLDIQNGNLGIYNNTNVGGGNSGAQLYLGDMNFAGGAYACSAPGIGAVCSPSAAGVAGDLAFFTYTGIAACRTERMRIAGGNVGIGTTSPVSLLHVQAANNVVGTIFVKGGKGDVTAVGEINSKLDFGSNDTSVNNDNNIGGRIASVTEYDNGAFVGMAFSTFQQGRSPDLKEAVRITNTGNVGIGTATPTNTFEIVKAQAATTTLYIENSNDQACAATEIRLVGNEGVAPLKNNIQISFVRGSGGCDWALGMPANSNDFVIAGGTNQGDGKPSLGTAERMRITSGGEIQLSGDLKFNSANTVYNASGDFYVRASTHLRLGAGGTNSLMTVFNNGNVAIGTSDIGYKLTLNGQPGANGYTAWTNYSDSRLKENVTDFDATNVLDKINRIRPVTYNYNELSGFDEATRERRISGFIAQELMEVFPDMVGTIKKEDTEYYDTNLSNLNLYLVKAIQEQQCTINTLKTCLGIA